MTQTATRHQATRTRSNCDKPQPATAASGPSPAPRKAPPRHKMALITWLGAYGVITGLLSVLGPAMSTWPLVLQTLLLSVLMVVTLTWVVLPTLTRVFRGWLTR
jgi:antibiotic biosynthesis monooxygenase (ABM) superfamily enzyme